MTDPVAPVRRDRRRHPALGARIAAAGIGTATMFGIVAALGLQSPPPAVTTQAQGPAPSGLVVVDPRVAGPTQVTVSEFSDQPIRLTATPIVRAAQPAAAPAVPVARTNGSR